MRHFHSANTWKIHLYHTDHLGTPQRLTDPQGQTQWSARTEAFGQTHITLNTINNPLRFPGQYHDVETDLHHNWNRDYNPNLGRYIQSDPIGLEGGVNVYGYVNARPTLNYDPNGLSPIGVTIAIICARGCAIGVAANYGYCMYDDLTSGKGLRECDVACTPTFCDVARDCVTGCIVNVLVPIPYARGFVTTFVFRYIKKLYSEMFGADPCEYLERIGYGVGAGREKPKPISDLFQ